jgi:hypothetical protein
MPRLCCLPHLASKVILEADNQKPKGKSMENYFYGDFFTVLGRQENVQSHFLS